MKTNFLKIAAILTGVLLVLSCSKDDDSGEIVKPVTVKDVYIAGNIGAGAVYWKNGVVTNLENSAIGNSVYVVNNDVYVAGATYNSLTSTHTAVYWKNGLKITLPVTGSSSSIAQSIWVSGNDVYVAGYQMVGSNGMIKLWKNGVAYNWTDGSSSTIPTSICVVGNDVYISGYSYENPIGYVAKYWKNGVVTNLSTSSPNREATASFITVSGNDVYVSGRENNGTKNVATYWKNGQIIALTNGINNSYASSLVVSGNDIYVSGYESNGSHYIAKYWKNGQANLLSDGIEDVFANDIKVINNDVFVVGRNTLGDLKYWKNGGETSFFPIGSMGDANDIFITTN